MFVTVKLLNGCPGFFTYKVPETYKKQIAIGSLIQVPFRKSIELALVNRVVHSLDDTISYTIRPIQTDHFFPEDTNYTDFIGKLSNYYCLEKFELFRRIQSFLHNKKTTVETVVPPKTIAKDVQKIELTAKQQEIVAQLSVQLDQPIYYPYLLHGITGSGKTEVYKKLIIENFNRSKTTILLLPEVSLAVQFTHLLKNQLPQYQEQIFGFHSAIGAKEKRLLWHHLLEQKPILIIGVHLPVLLPIAHLGLIIVDEEHETGFQEKRHPKIHTKEAALLRAHMYKIPIILGSATPSMSSLYQVEQKQWQYGELTERFSGNLPSITLINLSNKTKRRSQFWISAQLEEKMKDRLAKNEQILLFLNRRGYSFFLLCKQCGYMPACTHCSVTLTVHESQKMRCHYCDHTQMEPTECTECKAPAKELIKKGLGTQQLVSIVHKIFPTARVARADLDTTTDKKKWRATIEAFSKGEIDILVGTQTITKGYHFPQVSLVGIIWADLNLGLPVYTAAEVTLQQLIQVSGRAGRVLPHSEVIVQTMLEHDIYQYLEEKEYIHFYHNEIEKRKAINYPPFIRFSEIELKHADEKIINMESEQLYSYFSAMSRKHNLDMQILGPSTPPIYKIKNIFRRKIYIKARSMSNTMKLFKSIDKKKYKSSLFFTPNPLSL